MIDRKIDLTDNHDFSQGMIEMDTLTGIYLDQELMTPEQYETIVRWESIFGKKRHDNRKDKIFDKDVRYERSLEDHCQRCGVELKAPWKRFYGLCNRCNDIVQNDVQRIPWKVYNVSEGRWHVSDKGQNLFDLR